MRHDAAMIAPHRRFALLIFALLLTVCAAAGVAYIAVFHLRNFGTVQPGVLYRSGQLSPAGLQAVLGWYGINTVVSLRQGPNAAEPTADEWEEPICRQYGAKMIRIEPRSWIANPGGGLPAEQGVQDFLDILDEPANRPVLVHCFAGVHRTGALCAIHRLESQRWPAERALMEMEAFGFTPGANRTAIEQYLRGYHPRQ